jgi:predicted HD phosphohydrolase
MKTKYTLFRRGEVYYSQDATNGKQKSLHTRDEAEALRLLNALNEAQRQPALNLHLARAYLTASDPAFVERTWQTVMEQLQARGRDSSRERYATVFKSPCFDSLRHKKLLETTADDFFAVFKEGKVSIVYFLKRLHNFALEHFK